MKLTTLLVTISLVQLHAASLAQKITIQKNNTNLKYVLNEIRKQTGYTPMYQSALLESVKRIDVNLKDVFLEEALNQMLVKNNLSYIIEDKVIVIKRKNQLTISKDLTRYMLVDIKGKVVNEDEKPIEGVTIKVKGKNKGVSTDNNGVFSLNVDANDILVISSIGYVSQEISINNKSDLYVILKTTQQDLQEVVVVGYGTQRKDQLTSAVSTINAKDVALIPTTNLSNILAGRMSGVFVTSPTGTPGIGSQIRVRSASTFSSGTGPLYVIDGVVRDAASFNALDPNEIDQISTLKDAASAAIYGSRSSNGVILVTTKKGSFGKPTISYSTTFGVQKPGQLPKYMSFDDAVKMGRYIYGDDLVTDDEVADIKSWNPDGQANFRLAYRDPKNQRHALTVSGGSEHITYALMGSYVRETGFLPNLNYNKYNLRSNINAKITDDLSVSLNLNTSTGKRQRFNFTYDYGSDDLNNLWGKLYYFNVQSRLYVDDKPTFPGWLGNPIEMMKNGGYWKNNNQQIDALANVKYNVPFIPGLSSQVSYSQNINNDNTKSFAKKQLLYTYAINSHNILDPTQPLGTQYSGDPATEYISYGTGRNSGYQLNGQLNYDKKIGKHLINVIGVYEQFQGDNTSFGASRNNFPLFPNDQFAFASGDNKDWGNSAVESQDARLSYIGRFHYEYDNRYILEGTVRRDGSLKFAPSKRWGSFPTVSARWNISNELFLENTSFIDMLALRASYATTGNDAIGGWQWLEQYNIQNGSYFLGTNGTTAPILRYGGISNPNLTWERSETLGAGLDFNILKHLTLSANFYSRRTTDILGTRILAIPAEFGTNLPAVNYGQVNSKGLDLDLGYFGNITNDLSFNIKGTFGYATNEVIIRDVATNAQPVDNPIGKTLNYITGYESDGIYRTQADLDAVPSNFTILGVSPDLGMLQFRDISGPDGAPDGIVDTWDRAVLAKYTIENAPVQYGLNLGIEYKNFSINAMFTGLAGFKKSYNDGASRNTWWFYAYPEIWNGYWTEDNIDASVPKPFPGDDPRLNTVLNNSNFNVRDGSFVKLSYLQLGYRVPESVINRIGVKNLTVFASATNLFYISKFRLYDPEVASSMSYPNSRGFNFGINFNL
ncbi:MULTISPECIES: TonB-dependent receptor [unclassified Sphingobacterium]|uniref:TonB-dependent receptor n=1 Tax=unclassified Sphingobacterium TaxID=2609468 RepID=UPI001A9E223D|nr:MULTISPECIES: TonB-dependent receptor [unclassified Sphingobacterium]